MGQPEHPMPKSPTSHLHAMNLVVALLAGIISITGGIYSLKNNIFSGPAVGSLQGTVRDERIAKPLRLATVEISDLAGAVVNTATTDDDGHYVLEALKAGNYAVKFVAPLHKIETKTIRIEKDLPSTINVDLVPQDPPSTLASVESAALAGRTIQAPVSSPTYAAAVPAVSGYNATQSTAAAPTASEAYAQTGTVPDGTLSGTPRTGFRRHPRRSYSSGDVDSSSGTSQGSSQNSDLTQAGAQLLQALLSKRSETTSSTASTGS